MLKKKIGGRTLFFFLFLSLFLHASILLLPLFEDSSDRKNSEISVLVYNPSKSRKDGNVTRLRKNTFLNEGKESIKKEHSSVDEETKSNFSEEDETFSENSGEEVKDGGIPDELLKKIERNKFYPQEALREMVEGEVVLSFEVSEKGNVKELRIEKTSGNIFLDRAAIECVKRSQPLPPVSDRVEIVLRYIIKK